MIVPATICTATHADDPSGIGHLVIDMPQSGRHLVREGSRNNHDISLSGRCAKDNPKTVLVVSWH